MKKAIYRTLLLIAMGASVTGCQKESPLPVDEGSPLKIELVTSSQDVTVLDGNLVFENEAHLNQMAEKLSLMTPQERVEFEDDLGFRSQGTIFHLVTEAETNHQESFFEGLDPDLEVEECEALGYYYEPTALYTEFLEKGVIKETVYEDRSRAFDLAIDNPHLQNVINEEGSVIVGDKKIVLEGINVREYSIETGELLSETESGKVNLNGQYDFRKHARRPGHESADGTKWWINDPGQNNNYRYYAQAYFHSSFTTQLLAQTYYWIARAEQKKWGNWATRNNYNPIWGISANWAYDYYIQYKGQFNPTLHTSASLPLPNSANRPMSPYGLANLHTNYTVRYMHPHGTYTISAGGYFWENLRVYNHSYVFKFSGGPSGYSYTGQ